MHRGAGYKHIVSPHTHTPTFTFTHSLILSERCICNALSPGDITLTALLSILSIPHQPSTHVISAHPPNQPAPHDLMPFHDSPPLILTNSFTTLTHCDSLIPDSPMTWLPPRVITASRPPARGVGFAPTPPAAAPPVRPPHRSQRPPPDRSPIVPTAPPGETSQQPKNSQ
jgi:hypothetical protein